MDVISAPVIIEAIGWLAALLTVATFAAASMIRLRLLVIASSFCFAVYAVLHQIWPLLAVEIILIAVNAYRLWQFYALRRIVTHVNHDADVDYTTLMAYGRKLEIPAGTVIFEKGDIADRLFYLAAGKVEIEDQNITVPAGTIFGEMAFFTGTETRTATVKSVEDSVVYDINRKRFTRLQYEDPDFALAVMSTITKRLVANAAQSMADNPQ